jgi:hypothetical protein
MSKLKTHSNGLPSEVPYKITECKEKEMDYFAIKAQIGHLKGKVLTIIDASIENEQKNKAIKDLIHEVFFSQLDWIYQLCGLPEEKTASGSCNDEKTIVEQEIIIKK